MPAADNVFNLARARVVAPTPAPAPVVTKAPYVAPVTAPVAPSAPVNPFTLDYQQFLQATSPYMSAGINSWTSPEGQHGSIGLTLADGRTWTPSGANSGITYHPVGEPIMGWKNTLTGLTSAKKGAGRSENWEPVQIGTNQKETWDISGDMSALLGTPDSNAHKNITYELQNGKLVPTATQDWQYQNGGLGGFLGEVVSNPAFQVFAALTGASALGGLGGASTAAAAPEISSLDALLASNGAFGTAGGLEAAGAGAAGSGLFAPAAVEVGAPMALPQVAATDLGMLSGTTGSGLSLGGSGLAEMGGGSGLSLGGSSLAPAATESLGSGLTMGSAPGLAEMGGGTGLLSSAAPSLAEMGGAGGLSAGAVDSFLPGMFTPTAAESLGSGLTLGGAPGLAEMGGGSGLVAGGAPGLAEMGGGTGLVASAGDSLAMGGGLGSTLGALDTGVGVGSALGAVNTGVGSGLLSGAAPVAKGITSLSELGSLLAKLGLIGGAAAAANNRQPSAPSSRLNLPTTLSYGNPSVNSVGLFNAPGGTNYAPQGNSVVGGLFGNMMPNAPMDWGLKAVV